MLTLGQEIILEGFRARLDVSGRTIWVGAPDYQSAQVLFETVTELDPDFELVSDKREACRMHLIAPGPDIIPNQIILDGPEPLHPDNRWRVIAGQRLNNPTDPIKSYLVAKIL